MLHPIRSPRTIARHIYSMLSGLRKTAYALQVSHTTISLDGWNIQTENHMFVNQLDSSNDDVEMELASQPSSNFGQEERNYLYHQLAK